MAEQTGVCVYCAREDVITTDHIPPKGLVNRDQRHSLIRVRSCQDCNSGSSKDDEYFRMMLLMRSDVWGTSAAEDGVAALKRSLARDDHSSLLVATKKNIVPVEPRSTLGLVLPREESYEVDVGRMDRVVCRIVRGIYWHEFQAILPLDCVIHIHWESWLDLKDVRTLLGVKAIAAPLAQQEVRSVGGGVLAYRGTRASDAPTSTVWLLEFYGSVRLLAFTLKESEEPIRE